MDLACHPGQLPGHSLADLLVQHSQEAHCGRESCCIRRIRTRTCDLLGMGAHTSADGTTWLAPGPERSTWASMVGWHSMERVHLEWRHPGSIVGAVPPTDTRRSCGALQILGMPDANRNVPVPTWPWKAPEVSPPPGMKRGRYSAHFELDARDQSRFPGCAKVRRHLGVRRTRISSEGHLSIHRPSCRWRRR